MQSNLGLQTIAMVLLLNIAKSHNINMNFYSKEYDISKPHQTPSSNRVVSITQKRNNFFEKSPEKAIEDNKHTTFTQRIQEKVEE